MSTVTKKIVKKIVKTEESAPVAPKVETPVVEAPKEEVKADGAEVAKKRTRKTKAQKAAENGEEVAAEPRKVVNGDSVQKDMEDLITFCTEQLSNEAIDKKAAKVVRNVATRLRRLRVDLARVVKKTTKSSVPKDSTKLSNSGLMKPVPITADLAKFMNVPSGTLQSRVAVTNAICGYIKTNNLQNPANKREILPDATLVTLLGYSGEKEKVKLTYFYIQQLIQQHFVKTPAVVKA